MAQRKTLIELECVTDCDTGTYHIGEIDFGIHSGALDGYLKSYGHKGRDEIVRMMGYLIHEVHQRFNSIPRPNDQAAQTAG